MRIGRYDVELTGGPIKDWELTVSADGKMLSHITEDVALGIVANFAIRGLKVDPADTVWNKVRVDIPEITDEEAQQMSQAVYQFSFYGG